MPRFFLQNFQDTISHRLPIVFSNVSDLLELVPPKGSVPDPLLLRLPPPAVGPNFSRKINPRAQFGICKVRCRFRRDPGGFISSQAFLSSFRC